MKLEETTGSGKNHGQPGLQTTTHLTDLTSWKIPSFNKQIHLHSRSVFHCHVSLWEFFIWALPHYFSQLIRPFFSDLQRHSPAEIEAKVIITTIFHMVALPFCPGLLEADQADTLTQLFSWGRSQFPPKKTSHPNGPSSVWQTLYYIYRSLFSLNYKSKPRPSSLHQIACTSRSYDSESATHKYTKNILTFCILHS